MSSRKFGPTLVIDLTPGYFQLGFTLILCALLLRALSITDLCTFFSTFFPSFFAAFFVSFSNGANTVLSLCILLYAAIKVRSFITRHHCHHKPILFAQTEGSWLLRTVTSEELKKVTVDNLGIRGRRFMVLILRDERKRHAYVITPSMLGENLYRQLRVRLSLQAHPDEQDS